MGIFFVLLFMLFMHIVDDYYLQGILAKMKQKSWWEQNAPDRMYRYDFIPALITHALSWSFMIILPIFLAKGWNPAWWVYLVLICNATIHAVVDHLKANRRKINLIIDQSIHLLQIVVTWLLFVLI